jgi:hypothetical protein
VKGFSAKSKHGIQYPNLPLAKLPVPHDGFPHSEDPSDWAINDEGEESLSDIGHGATSSIMCQDPYSFFPTNNVNITSSHHSTRDK